jgi:hypothetical protein
MESSCASSPPAREPENIEAAGKAREWETNASDLFEAPQAAEERETNAPLPKGDGREHGDTGNQRFEEGDCAARRDWAPLTSAAQAAGESSSPSQERTVAKDVVHQVCPDPGAGGKVEEGGYWSDTAATIRIETPPTDRAAGNGTTCHTSGFRCQLIRFLKGGSDYFTPGEVCRIIRAAKLSPKGSLNAINMLDEDMQLFTYSFPDANEGELREQCRNTVLEYEE